ESPRWLMIHGRNREAEEIVADVERKISAKRSSGVKEYWSDASAPESITPSLQHCNTPAAIPTRIRTRTHTPWREIWDAIVHEHLFDTIGRKQMITLTYGLAGILLALTGLLFQAGMLTAQAQTLAWTIIFFIASAAASSAYLTVSEIFPLEIRAVAIAIFYAIGTLAGGVGAPILFGWIIGTGSVTALFIGYLVAAALMIFGAITEAWIGVPAERRSLEHVAAPLSSKGL